MVLLILLILLILRDSAAARVWRGKGRVGRGIGGAWREREGRGGKEKASGSNLRLILEQENHWSGPTLATAISFNYRSLNVNSKLLLWSLAGVE